MDQEHADLVEVEFRLPAADADTVAVAGEFNDWSADADRMERQADGSWSVTLRLPPGRHRFRYLLDGTRWENDWAADAYEPNELGVDNSVRVVRAPEANAGPVADVTDAEAQAIAAETSAEQIKPDTELVAPTTGDPAGGQTDSPPAASPERRGPSPGPEPGADEDRDGRQLQQGSGQPSPSIGEQQQSVAPTTE